MDTMRLADTNVLFKTRFQLNILSWISWEYLN